MKLKFILLAAFLHFAAAVSAITAVDSLKAVLAKAGEDTVRVNTLLALSKANYNEDVPAAISYAQHARQTATKIGFTKGVAQAYKSIGIANYMQGNYLAAIEAWNNSLKSFQQAGDKVGVANILSNIGAIYFNQADDANALEYYLKSLKVSEELGDKLRIATVCNNIGAVYFNKRATYGKALEYYLRALPLAEEVKDDDAIGTATVNLGELYLEKENIDSALFYLERSRKAYANSENLPYSLNDLGRVYVKRGDFAQAIAYHQQAYQIAQKLDAKLDMLQSNMWLGEAYRAQGNGPEALDAYKRSEELAHEIDAKNDLKRIYEGLSLTYSMLKNYEQAYNYRTLYAGIKDTLYNTATDKKLAALQFNFDIEKKEGQIKLLQKDKALQDLDLKRQKVVKNSLLAGLLLVFVIAFILYRNYREKARVNLLLDKQNAEIEALILNILPEEVARELQRDGQATPRYYESVSVLFTDFKGFSSIAEGMPPNELVSELNEFFNAFDDIIENNGLEKIKTIGDAYMCAGGIPSADTVHPVNIVKAGLEIQRYMREKNARRESLGFQPWDLRIGIHTGPVVAGVVGRIKYAYDIWGNTVNIASRMESNGAPGKVNISAATFNMVKDHFSCSYRGKIQAKNIGIIDMYFVEASLVDESPVVFEDAVITA